MPPILVSSSRRTCNAVAILAAAGLALVLAAPARAAGAFQAPGVGAGGFDKCQCGPRPVIGEIGRDSDVHFGSTWRAVLPNAGFRLADTHQAISERSYVLGAASKAEFLDPDDEPAFPSSMSAPLVLDVTAAGRFPDELAWRDQFFMRGRVSPGDLAIGAGARARRFGFEWAFNSEVALIGERIRAVDEWITRGGVRYFITPALNLDVSALRINGTWGGLVALRHAFDR